MPPHGLPERSNDGSIRYPIPLDVHHSPYSPFPLPYPPETLGGTVVGSSQPRPFLINPHNLCGYCSLVKLFPALKTQGSCKAERKRLFIDFYTRGKARIAPHQSPLHTPVPPFWQISSRGGVGEVTERVFASSYLCLAQHLRTFSPHKKPRHSAGSGCSASAVEVITHPDISPVYVKHLGQGISQTQSVIHTLTEVAHRTSMKKLLARHAYRSTWRFL